MATRENTQIKHQEILDEVNRLMTETGPDGKTLKYRPGYVYLMVGIQHNMKPGSIRNIWYNPDEYAYVPQNGNNHATAAA